MMKRRSALVGSALCFILAAPGWSAESPGKVAPLKGVKYLGSHLVPSDAQKKVTHITGAHFVPAGNDSTGALYLLSGDAGAGFTGSNGWGVYSKPRYYKVDLSRVTLNPQTSNDYEFLPSEVSENQIIEGRNAQAYPLWLNDGHIAPSGITMTKDGKLLISSSHSERDFTGVIDYRALDIPAYAGYGYKHANRDETSMATRNNGFLKAWYDAHDLFPVPLLDLVPAAFLHIFREIPLQLSKGFHWYDVGLSSKFLLTNSDDQRAGQVDGAFKLPKHYENNNWIPFHRGLNGIQKGLGVKSLDNIPGSYNYVSATAGALVQDATKWTVRGIVPPARVVTFTTEQLATGGQLLARQYQNSDELPARGEVSTLSEKLYNFSLLTLKPEVRKQLKSDPIRTISDIAVLNNKQALFLEKTELPYQGTLSRFITRVYLVDLTSGKDFKGKEMFVDNELNDVFMTTPADFMSKSLVFDSTHRDSQNLIPNSPEFNFHQTGFEAIALGPDTTMGEKTFMLVSYDDGEPKGWNASTRLLHFTLPPRQ
ncbi:esterase-like activity of phytase family protein [Endozoicomonas arenosclerae]|uniref:esterase-like activity of phytase family protein n=1 Tax=Endozoicomonas arenosclerae TaxID=1633495 RepID=UPI00156101A6|nr:esterase-like activity of phytase family protein [Endozoicomonas arenosclerae]